MLQLLALLVIVAGVLLLFLPVGECRECGHCEARKRAEKAEQDRLRREYEKHWHIGDDDPDRHDR